MKTRLSQISSAARRKSQMQTPVAASRQSAIIVAMPVGLYISVPFCRTKCSYCNFASDVFSHSVFRSYVDRVCADMKHANQTVAQMGGSLEHVVDSIYLGGGTPTVLDISLLERLFVTIGQNFVVQPGAEITVECAPGTLTPAVLEALNACGVNRVSLGVQSFVDQEAASVGRLHNRTTVLDDIRNLQAAIDLNQELVENLWDANRGGFFYSRVCAWYSRLAEECIGLGGWKWGILWQAGCVNECFVAW